MPSIDDLLKKNKDRIDRISAPSQRKKITREGATRPWQTNLPQYSGENRPEIEVKAETPINLDEPALPSQIDNQLQLKGSPLESDRNPERNVESSLTPGIGLNSESLDNRWTKLNGKSASDNLVAGQSLDNHGTIAGQGNSTTPNTAFDDNGQNNSNRWTIAGQIKEISTGTGENKSKNAPLTEKNSLGKLSRITDKLIAGQSLDKLKNVSNNNEINQPVNIKSQATLVSDKLKEIEFIPSALEPQLIQTGSQELDQSLDNRWTEDESESKKEQLRHHHNLKQSLDNHGTIARQSLDNHGTIARQSLDNHGTIARQSLDNHGTIARQSLDKKSEIAGQSLDKSLDSSLDNRWTNSNPKSEEKLTSLHFLSDQQRRLIEFLFIKCFSTGTPITEPITSREISERLKISKQSKDTQIKRLLKSGSIEAIARKDGPGGWAVYKISTELYRELISRSSTADNRWTDRWTDRWTIAGLSSSSILNNELNTTTGALENLTNKDSISPLPPEWSQIDYSGLREIHFGQSHLMQIAQLGKLTPVEAQESINAFEFDLKNNEKAKELKTTPLNFFFGILRKGNPYVPPENYESPEDEARRKVLESKKKRAAERTKVEEELFEIEFLDWLQTLSPEKKQEFAPYAKVEGSEMQISTLKEYFRKEIFHK